MLDQTGGRKPHSGSDGEEMTAAQLAEYKENKAELREAREGLVQEQSGILPPLREIPGKE